MLRNHFFLYRLSAEERMEVVRKMMVCRIEANNYIFRQGDVASGFFIIAEGRVEVEIGGQKKKVLQKGDYFG